MTPQNNEAMAEGAVETMGNETASEISALAMNQQAVAMAHIIPEMMPGNIVSGYTWQEVTEEYNI